MSVCEARPRLTWDDGAVLATGGLRLQYHLGVTQIGRWDFAVPADWNWRLARGVCLYGGWEVEEYLWILE